MHLKGNRLRILKHPQKSSAPIFVVEICAMEISWNLKNVDFRKNIRLWTLTASLFYVYLFWNLAQLFFSARAIWLPKILMISVKDWPQHVCKVLTCEKNHENPKVRAFLMVENFLAWISNFVQLFLGTRTSKITKIMISSPKTN